MPARKGKPEDKKDKIYLLSYQTISQEGNDRAHARKQVCPDLK
jgi:hypothetical protein